MTLGQYAGLIALISIIPYARDVICGRTKPERASWLIWAVLTTIAAVAQRAEGANETLWFSAVTAAGFWSVFILSIKFGVGGLAGRDLKALSVAAIGLVLWWLTDQPLVAIFIVIAIDCLALVLTFIKNVELPQSETEITWLLESAASILAVFAAKSTDWRVIIFPAFVATENFIIYAQIRVLKSRQKSD
jgi:hypothetical protein